MEVGALVKTALSYNRLVYCLITASFRMSLLNSFTRLQIADDLDTRPEKV